MTKRNALSTRATPSVPVFSGPVLSAPVLLLTPVLALLFLTACADTADTAGRPMSAATARSIGTENSGAENLGASTRAPSYAVLASAVSPRTPPSPSAAPLPVHEGHDAPLGTGVVNSIDATGRRMNIRHEPIPAIGWPGMTMDFPVAASADLRAVKPGDRIRFRLRKGQGDAYEILSVQPARGQ